MDTRSPSRPTPVLLSEAAANSRSPCSLEQETARRRKATAVAKSVIILCGRAAPSDSGRAAAGRTVRAPNQSPQDKSRNNTKREGSLLEGAQRSGFQEEQLREAPNF